MKLLKHLSAVLAAAAIAAALMPAASAEEYVLYEEDFSSYGDWETPADYSIVKANSSSRIDAYQKKLRVTSGEWWATSYVTLEALGDVATDGLVIEADLTMPGAEGTNMRGYGIFYGSDGTNMQTIKFKGMYDSAYPDNEFYSFGGYKATGNIGITPDAAEPKVYTVNDVVHVKLVCYSNRLPDVYINGVDRTVKRDAVNIPDGKIGFTMQAGYLDIDNIKISTNKRKVPAGYEEFTYYEDFAAYGDWAAPADYSFVKANDAARMETYQKKLRVTSQEWWATSYITLDSIGDVSADGLIIEADMCMPDAESTDQRGYGIFYGSDGTNRQSIKFKGRYDSAYPDNEFYSFGGYKATGNWAVTPDAAEPKVYNKNETVHVKLVCYSDRLPDVYINGVDRTVSKAAVTVPDGKVGFTMQAGYLDIDNIRVSGIRKIPGSATVDIVEAIPTETGFMFVTAASVEGEPDISEFGTVVLPLWLLNNNDTETQESLSYNGAIYDGMTYGVEISDIPEGSEDTYIAAKSFITANGSTFWTPYVFASMNDLTIRNFEGE